MLIPTIGSYIGFAGSSWTDRPNVQTLSTIIPMQCHPTDTATRYKAARHIGALRSAIHSLDAYYRGEMQAHETSLTSFTSPHNPMFPYPSCFTSLDNSTKKSFTYTSHPMDDKLVFLESCWMMVIIYALNSSANTPQMHMHFAHQKDLRRLFAGSRSYQKVGTW